MSVLAFGLGDGFGRTCDRRAVGRATLVLCDCRNHLAAFFQRVIIWRNSDGRCSCGRVADKQRTNALKWRAGRRWDRGRVIVAFGGSRIAVCISERVAWSASFSATSKNWDWGRHTD